LKFSRNLSLLREVIEAHPHYKIVVIDEIQKLPQLLDEVHSLIFDFEDKIQFILTGSSARKLKRHDVNLLAGRALVRNFHPYSLLEIENKFNLNAVLEFGMLPQVWNLKTANEKKDYLLSYTQTYLQEEIQREAAVRKLPSYILFLEHFAIRNSQVINLNNISSEIGVARTTVIGYVELLEQTMLGFKLPPIELKAKVKEVATPKFYFFDTGVVRALSQNLDSPLAEDKGSQLETYVLHELKTYSDYFQKRWGFYYWGTPSDSEVDFIITQGKNKIGIEVKSSKTWDKDFSRGLEVLLSAGKITAAYGVYNGTDTLVRGAVKIYPIEIFI
jgi:predicted AAA+ superfamily ATPase